MKKLHTPECPNGYPGEHARFPLPAGKACLAAEKQIIR